MKIIRAAGGLVWREDGAERVAVIHRPRQDDWTLPKGKLDQDEPWDAAALREVREETGCEVQIDGFAGVVHDVARHPPRVILYWNMSLRRECPREPDSEVDEVAWLTPAEALRRLDRRSDRRLLEECMRRRNGRVRRAAARLRSVAILSAAVLTGAMLALAGVLLLVATGLWRACPA